MPHDPTTTRLLVSLAFVFACSACGSSGSTNGSEPVSEEQAVVDAETCSFDTPSSGPPAEWISGTTNGETDAVWEVLPDESAPSPAGALALLDTRGNSGQEFNLCWEPTISLANIDVSVSLRADGGAEDQGGGPAWRLTSAGNYYAARWNPLEDNFRVYSIVDGRREQLDSEDVSTDRRAWHTIRVRQVGTSITCWFDGEELLHADDAKLTSPGAVGLWTKADATTRFDDLTVSAAN